MKIFRQLLLLFASYYHSFLIGIFVAIRGFLLPQIQEDFNISYTSSGLMILVTIIPGFFGSLFSGYIFTLFNKKIILIISSIFVFVFCLLIQLSNSYYLFLLFTILMATGSFILATGANILVTDVFENLKPKYKDNGLTIFHFLFSSGGATALILNATILKNNSNWKNIYFFLGIAFIMTFILLILSKYPKVSDCKAENNCINFKTFSSLLINKKILFFAICILFYGGLEIGLISWVPTFLEKGFNFSKAYISSTLLVFFLLFTLGRFIGVLIMHKVNKVIFLLITISASLICMICGIIFRIRLSNIDIFISLSGLFFSVIFPTIQNLLVADFRKNLSAATGIFFAANSIGATFLPFAIGVLNDLFSVKYGIIIICFFCVVIIPTLLLAIKKEKKLQDNIV